MAYRESDFSSARKHFAQAVVDSELGGHDRARALALSALTTIPGLSYREALDYGTRAQLVIERVQGTGALRANVEILLADLHYHHGQYAESEKASLIDVAEALVALAGTQRKQGKLDQAIVALRRALQVHGEVFGEEHLNRALILSNLCVALTDRYVTAGSKEGSPDVAEARACCDQAVAIAEKHNKSQPEDVRTLATYHSSLARLLLATGAFEDAAAHFARALDLAKGTEGHPVDLATMEVGLASCLAYLNRDLMYALSLAKGARDVYRENFGEMMAAELDAMIRRLEKATASR